MKKISILTVVLLFSLSLAACVKIGANPINKTYYRIAPLRAEPTRQNPKDIILKVRRMTVSDLYNSRELIYQMSDGRIESDFYNMFFVTPGNMLTTELRKWLNESELFAHIVEPGSMVVPALTLEGVVNSLYGDYTTKQPEAIIEMQFFVVDENTAENEIVFSKNYSRRIPLLQPDSHILVQAMTQGVQEIYTDLEHDLAANELKR